MDGLRIEEMAQAPAHNNMQQHLHQKLGKPTEMGQKTPLRTGLGMIINESKTPGAKSLQNFASARKATPATLKHAAPIGFEIFQDQENESTSTEETPQVPCSPIDTVNRLDYSDSLAADIADDMLNLKDADVELFDELPTTEYADPESTEETMNVKPWDHYPPIEIASRIADDFDYPISVSEFQNEGDVKLYEGDYPNLYADVAYFRPESIQENMTRMEQKFHSIEIDELLTEQDNIHEQY